MYDVFNDKKSRNYLEDCLKEVDPAVKYSSGVEQVLKGLSKVFLIELFEESVEVAGKMHKNIDEEVLDEANRRMNQRYCNKEV